jgi:hypothetical protein
MENACKDNGIVINPFPTIPEFFIIGHMVHGSRRFMVLVHSFLRINYS